MASTRPLFSSGQGLIMSISRDLLLEKVTTTTAI
ncbi:hypothetical protein L917_07732 [Phytophthora nicotianae]|uniref:Uncharacterized protein n=1 Tax=Phytophthora nicotianae TaxID=4792 RepID=W2LA50_PHYNI|nr:hypothetical protein L917_07732 [Phytophthora nicotianae]